VKVEITVVLPLMLISMVLVVVERVVSVEVTALAFIVAPSRSTVSTGLVVVDVLYSKLHPWSKYICRAVGLTIEMAGLSSP
jgi:hypothetical protein